jgi:hypothetical protein
LGSTHSATSAATASAATASAATASAVAASAVAASTVAASHAGHWKDHTAADSWKDHTAADHTKPMSVVRRSHLLCRILTENLEQIEFVNSDEHEDACSDAIIRTFDAEEISDQATKKSLFQSPKRANSSAIVCLTRSTRSTRSTTTNAIPYPSTTESDQVIPFEDGRLSPNKLYFVRHPGGKMRSPDSILFYRSNDDQYHLLYFEYKSNKLGNDTITCNNTNPASEHIYIVNRKLLWSGSVYATESDNLKFERFKSMEARRNRIFKKQGLPTTRPGARKFKLSNFVESKNTSGMVFRLSNFLRHLK